MDRINNYFVKSPVTFTLTLSLLISIGVFLISLDYRKGSTEVVINSTLVEEDPVDVKADLSGAVKNPGMYTLKEGSRVGDLLVLGGGFLSDASALWVSKNINMSQIITDGQKIYIPFEWDLERANAGVDVDPLVLRGLVVHESTQSVPTENVPPESDRLNVNNASSSQLDGLPGIGPAYAERIIENRPYQNFDDFKSKSGLSVSLSTSIKSLISF